MKIFINMARKKKKTKVKITEQQYKKLRETALFYLYPQGDSTMTFKK